MSYVRFAWEGSEVYVYEGSDGLTCCGCRLNEGGFVCETPEAMIAHLALHRRAGQFVPDSAITGLWADIPGAQRPERPEPRTLTVATLMMHLMAIETELRRQHGQLSAGDQKMFPVPPGLRPRLDPPPDQPPAPPPDTDPAGT